MCDLKIAGRLAWAQLARAAWPAGDLTAWARPPGKLNAPLLSYREWTSGERNIAKIEYWLIQFGNTPTLLSSGELLTNEKHSFPINNFKLKKKTTNSQHKTLASVKNMYCLHFCSNFVFRSGNPWLLIFLSPQKWNGRWEIFKSGLPMFQWESSIFFLV